MCFARTTLSVILTFLWASYAQAIEIEDHKLLKSRTEASVLRVISTGDLDFFLPILEAFQDAFPSISIDYTVTGTTDVMRAILEGSERYDLVISSAMDLQTKLANDGFAQAFTPPAAAGLPHWITWRDQIFAFTQEPSVLVVSDTYFGQLTAPRNRDELIEFLRSNPQKLRGKIGTYDVRKSGYGYLMATQDSRNSEAYWRLMEVMGRLDARLYRSSGDMILDVSSGKLSLAYNVLGSYAARKLKEVGGFRIVMLDDFTNVMLRSALIPTNAINVDDARKMVNFLIEISDHSGLVEATGLPPVNPIELQHNTALRPIRFGPGLLVFLDQLKRENFLRSWESSLEQN